MKKLSSIKSIDPISFGYYLLCYLLGLKLITRILRLWSETQFEQCLNLFLWQNLFAVVLTFMVAFVFVMCFSSQQSPPRKILYFTTLILSIYFISLLLEVFLPFSFSLNTISRIFFFFLIIGIFFAAYAKSFFKGKRIKLKNFLSMENVLIFLWLVHSLSLCFEFNFVPHRQLYGDEYTFWVNAARSFSQQDFLGAHVMNYRGGGLHPFGIPFFMALPSLLFSAGLTHSIFFFPVLVIFLVFILLHHIKSRPWIFIYFLTALVACCNHRGWLGKLTYQLSYGDAVSAVLFFVLYLISLECLDDRRFFSGSGMVFAFGMGLMMLTKNPLILFVPAFFVIMMILGLRELNCFKKRLMLFVVACIVFISPFLTWKYFSLQQHLPDSHAYASLDVLVKRLFDPDLKKVAAIGNFAIKDAFDFVFFSGLSCAFFICLPVNRNIQRFLPIGLFLVFILFYYSYIYAYQRSDGDVASSLRYLFTAALALFYFGGLCLNELVVKVERLQRPGWLRFLIMLFLVAVIIWPMM